MLIITERFGLWFVCSAHRRGNWDDAFQKLVAGIYANVADNMCTGNLL